MNSTIPRTSVISLLPYISALSIPQVAFTDELALDGRKVTKEGRSFALAAGKKFLDNRPKAGWLVVVDTHSLQGQGGMVTRIRKGKNKSQIYMAQLVSKVRFFFFAHPFF
jgi:hypothetical protein